MVIRTRSFLLGLLLLADCTVGPDFTPPKIDTPDTYRQGGNGQVENDAIDPQWWHVLNDPLLDWLVDRVADKNLDVQTAAARIAESRAQLGITSADLYPQVEGDASGQIQKLSDKGEISLISGGAGAGAGGAAGGGQAGIPSMAKTPAFKVYQYGFDVSWEIDLWGHVRRGVESAEASLQASVEAQRGAELSAVAELVRDYVQLRGVQASLALLRQDLKDAREIAGLVQSRSRTGLSSSIDLANAEAQAATVQAQVPQLEQQEAEARNAITLLLALPPGALDKDLAQGAPVPPVPPQVPVGVPSELARRRPDVRQAEAQLHAATAQIGVAVAEFYPKLTLMGNGMLQSLNLDTLNEWAARSYTFGPSVSLPIFEGGRLSSTLDLRKDQEKEAAIQYRRAVLNAFHDVDNALTAFRAEQARRDALDMAVAENRKAMMLARERYRNGLADFITVLTDEQNMLQADQQRVQSNATVTENMVQLYKALGGGWETAFPAQAQAQGK